MREKVQLIFASKQNYRERHTGHGLSDEEKKDSSDNFELHLELWNSRDVAVVLSIGFLLSQMSLI